MTMILNRDGTLCWKSSKVKKLLEDFDATIGTRTVIGKTGDHRTEVITVKPCDSTNTLEIMGVNKDIKMGFKNRKDVDIKYFEVRGAVESDDEEILIANAIIVSRLSKLGIKVLEKDNFKRKWTGIY